MPDRHALAERLADRLTAQNELHDPRWRQALHEVPRHLFTPRVAWANPDGPAAGYPIDRGQDEDRWWDAVYFDTSLITQIDDGTGDLTNACSWRNSGQRTTIGTGTGWTAGLLSWRVGDAKVTSIEIDPVLSDQAGKNLAIAGFSPRLVVGDGAAGHPETAPYDRVHVACAVADIPYAWVVECRRYVRWRCRRGSSPRGW